MKKATQRTLDRCAEDKPTMLGPMVRALHASRFRVRYSALKRLLHAEQDFAERQKARKG